MTLLIATISNTNLVITADGLSRAHPVTGGGIQSTAFEKIFPLTHMAVAIAHHGFNVLDGHPVNEFLHPFMRKGETDFSTLGVREIAVELKKFTDSAAQAVLNSPINDGVIGFWIAGFANETPKPLLYEICWPDHSDPVLHEPIVFGGDGKEFVVHYIDEFRQEPAKCEEIRKYSIDDALRLHSKFYEEAERKQNEEGRNIFGGHQHQLTIQPDGWRWMKAPCGFSG